MSRSTLIVGCGYLGRRVAARLLDRGERVLGTTRSMARAEELRAIGIEPVLYEALAPTPLPATDRVFHCVGYDRTAGVPIRDVYVDGLRRVLERIEGAGSIVYASSTGVYGDSAGAWIDEETAPSPSSESGRACLDAEGLIAEFAERRSWPATILRFAGLYGPGRIIRREPTRRGEPVAGDPDKWVNLVQIDDAATAAVAALDQPGPVGLTRVFNVVDDRPVRRRELYGLTARLLGGPEPEFLSCGQAEPNKRVANRRIREQLGFVPAFADITTGLPAALGDEASGG